MKGEHHLFLDRFNIVITLRVQTSRTFNDATELYHRIRIGLEFC